MENRYTFSSTFIAMALSVFLLPCEAKEIEGRVCNDEEDIEQATDRIDGNEDRLDEVEGQIIEMQSAMGLTQGQLGLDQLFIDTVRANTGLLDILDIKGDVEGGVGLQIVKGTIEVSLDPSALKEVTGKLLDIYENRRNARSSVEDFQRRLDHMGGRRDRIAGRIERDQRFQNKCREHLNSRIGGSSDNADPLDDAPEPGGMTVVDGGSGCRWVRVEIAPEIYVKFLYCPGDPSGSSGGG